MKNNDNNQNKTKIIFIDSIGNDSSNPISRKCLRVKTISIAMKNIGNRFQGSTCLPLEMI
jgi:hypothetical protein